MQYKGKRFQLIEVQVPANVPGSQNRFNIGDQPQLRSDQFKVVEIAALRSYNDVVIGFTPSGLPTVPEADFGFSYLVLNIGGSENFLYLPLKDLNNSTASDFSVQEVYQFDPVVGVDWSKSYILHTGTSVTQTAFSYLIGVWYSVLPDDRNNRG